MVVFIIKLSFYNLAYISVYPVGLFPTYFQTIKESTAHFSVASLDSKLRTDFVHHSGSYLVMERPYCSFFYSLNFLSLAHQLLKKFN